MARARDLANGRDLPLDTVKRMASFFARHAVNKQAEGSSSAGRWGDDDNPSAGYVAWLLWGGDAAASWSKRISDEAREDSVTRWSSIEVRTDSDDRLRPDERAHLRKPRRLADGSWRYDAVVARGDDLKEYEEGVELVPWDELAHDDTIDSLEGVLLLDDHAGWVDPATAASLPSLGRLTGVRRVDGARILVGTLVTPQRLRHAGVSVGWDRVRLDRTPGKLPDGRRYDAIQRGLRANHLASTPQPRVSGAAARLDAQVGKSQEGSGMADLVIDGVRAEVSEAFAAAYAKERDGLRQRADGHDAARVRVAELEATVADLQQHRQDAADLEARIKAEVAERVKLVAQAQGRVSDEDAARLDSLTAHEIRQAIVKHAKVEGIDMNAPAEVKAAAAVVLSRRADGLGLPAPGKGQQQQERKAFDLREFNRGLNAPTTKEA